MAKRDRPANPFAEVDQTPPAVAVLLVEVLRQMAANPEIQRVRALALDALRVHPGQRLLDAGAGGGEVARQLAALVAPDGDVVALDLSETLVAAARERDDGSAVEYRQGSVTALDFPDDTFGGVRCERVLQHVPDPDKAVAELLRVTRPGGRVVLVDTDWESLAFDGAPEDLVARLREFQATRMPQAHRNMGRTLRRRLYRAGARDVQATPLTLYFETVAEAAGVLPFLDRSLPMQAEVVPAKIRERWFDALDAAQARNEFCAVLTLWVVAGVAG